MTYLRIPGEWMTTREETAFGPQKIFRQLKIEKIESVQYSAALAITGAWRGTSRQKLYAELGWESLSSSRWSRRLTLFYDKVIRDDQAVSEHLNHYFANIADTLKIAKIIKEPVQTTGDPIQDCIQAYPNHPSILRIKGMVDAREKFEFSQVDPTTVVSEIQKMNATKMTSGAIPTDKLKLASNICYHINNAIDMNVFPDILKLADVSPIFKNGESTTDANYRPISVLSSVSKIYERLLSKQILPHISQYLSDLLCGFREKYSTQDALIRLIERCRKCLDKRGIVGMVLMDLSKKSLRLPAS